MRIAIGLDGGGTKTDCVLMDQGGHVMARGRGGPSNSSRIGLEAATRGAKEAVEAALASTGIGIGQVTDVCAGLAGVTDAGRAAAMTILLKALFVGARFELCTDLDLALMASGTAPSIVLVAGTGSAAIGRDAKGHIARSGGYGPGKSDEGSAFAVGKRVVAEVVKSRDQAGIELRRRILEQLGLESLENAEGLAGEAADALYPRVFPVTAIAADEGNEIARSVLRDAAANLAGLVAGVHQELKLGAAEFFLGKTGGMVERSRYFDEVLNAELQQVVPRAKGQILRTPLAEVAAKRALSL
jgi:N-acetylglucosamine kinase-like BadF-type ATPase